ncbi:MAG: radical SAM protein, partial [Lactococcus sp.]|uniref:radical SAM protein n=1 Tax=Lactococcus sp. TaxID=44273 RepID=UPI002FCA0336
MISHCEAKSIKKLSENRGQLSAPNFLIVPTYACNLKCIYCYEDSYLINQRGLTSDVMQLTNQFTTIDSIVSKSGFHNREIAITLMGGEPLLKTNVRIIETALELSKQRGYKVNVVTNGVDLGCFIDLFVNYFDVLSHIQITLDGSQDVHDKRRIYRDGSGSFDIIWKNIKEAISYLEQAKKRAT